MLKSLANSEILSLSFKKRLNNKKINCLENKDIGGGES